MKKLLSLLSVLTISGAAVPTTIAGSPYQKEEKLNSNINYSQINNLEILNRNKRQNNNIKKLYKMFLKQKYSPNLRWRGELINANNLDSFYRELQIYISSLVQNGIIINNGNLIGGNDNSIATYNFNSQSSNFRNQIIFAPIGIQNTLINSQWQASLVIIPRNLEVQGIIFTPADEEMNITNSHYFYFNNADIRSIEGVTNNNELNFAGNYPTLISNPNQNFSWNGILNNITNLLEYLTSRINNNDKIIIDNSLKMGFAFLIFLFSEAARTFEIGNALGNISIYEDQTINIRTNILNYATNWNSNSNIGSMNFNTIRIFPVNNPLTNQNCNATIQIRRQPITYCFNENTRNIRSINNDSSTCLPISNENPYFDRNNDYFKIIWNYGHDGLVVKLSLNTARVIEKIFLEKTKQEFELYLSKLFWKLPLTGNGGAMFNEYTWYVAYIISNEFWHFHEEVIKLVRNGNPGNKSIFIATRNTYGWSELTSDQRRKAIYVDTTDSYHFD